jgi:hypothetical protein
MQVIPLISLFAAIAVVAEVAKKAHERVANDPPREDFRQPVSLTWRPFRDRFPDDPTSRSGVPFIFATAQATALLEAMVLATERAEGAASQRQHEHLVRRLDERERFALQAWQALLGIEDAAPRLASVLPDFLLDPPGGAVPGITLDMLVPAGALSVLKGIGISPTDLKRHEIPMPNDTSLRGALYALASEAGEFGRELRRSTSPSSEAFVQRYN